MVVLLAGYVPFESQADVYDALTRYLNGHGYTLLSDTTDDGIPEIGCLVRTADDAASYPVEYATLTLEVGPNHPPPASLTDALLAADEGECIEVSRKCWNCGWHEKRQGCVAAIETTDGDETAIERAALLDESTDELEAIEHLATLEDALTEGRRQQRLEPSTADTDADTPA